MNCASIIFFIIKLIAGMDIQLNNIKYSGCNNVDSLVNRYFKYHAVTLRQCKYESATLIKF